MRPFDLSAVLVYPNTRDIAFASLGFLKVHQMLAERVDLADLAYLPRGENDAVLSPGRHILLGERSRAPVRQFDIVGFSVSWENDFAHLPELLLAAGMPPRAQDRPGALPLVICGGFTMSMNPLPIAEFVDAVVVGEAEAVIDRLLEAVEAAGTGRLDKSLPSKQATGVGASSTKVRLLERLSAIEGVWVPSLGKRELRRVWTSAEDFGSEAAGREESHFGDMFLVEVGRGCGRGCLFCAAGNLYRPVRMRREETILERAGDARRVGLVGTAVGDHPALVNIMERFAAEGRTVGLGSFRADAVTPEIARLAVKCGIRTLTLAPEAGSDSLRARIGKRITRPELIKAVETLAAAGIRRIKLYFMIGLPGETEEDILEITELVRDLARVRGRTQLSVAVAPFIPKAHTAFQWSSFIDKRTFLQRVALLKKIPRIKGCSLKLASYQEAWLEAVLSRGDRSLSAALLEAAEKQTSLRTVLKRQGVADIHGALDIGKPLPWDFIASGLPKEGLKEKYLKAVATGRG